MNKKRLVDWIAYFLLWTLSFYLVFLNQENGHRLFILTNQESNGYFKFGFLVVIEKAFCPGIFLPAISDVSETFLSCHLAYSLVVN